MVNRGLNKFSLIRYKIYCVVEHMMMILCTKDHIYRMVIVEGRCTMARSSSLGANYSLVDTKV